MPLIILPFSRKSLPATSESSLMATEVASRAQRSAQAADGVSFKSAICGLDFWLAFLVQFAVFGVGISTNQNLGLILESAGLPTASGLGVALFALTSSLS